MKRKKLLKTLSRLLDMKGHKQREHRDELKVLLRKLKKKKVELEERVRLEQDERKRTRLDKELEIINAQRIKGLKTLEELMQV